MTDPQLAGWWPPHILRQQLGPLDPSRASPASVRRYQVFYGLDLPQRPRILSRLGLCRVLDYDLAVQAWWPEQPVGSLLLLHGYYDHMGLYRHLVDWGLSLNLAVLACDLPGHGLSSGAPASIRDFAEYQQVLQALLAEARRLALPAPWHLLGQSTGGAILVDHLLLGPPRAEPGRCLLLAPLVRPRSWRLSCALYHLLRPWLRQVPRSYGANSSDRQFLQFVRRGDPLQARILPLAWVGALERWIHRIEAAAPQAGPAPLIVQGGQDTTVDGPYNLQVLARKFAGPDVLHLPAARHHLANECPALRQQYLAWLAARL